MAFATEKNISFEKRRPAKNKVIKGYCPMITDQLIDQALAELRNTCGAVREDYYGLLYLEKEHNLPRHKALNQITFGGNDYGVDGFYFDEQRRNLYIFQFKYTESHTQFKESLIRLNNEGMNRIFANPNKDDKKNQILLQLWSCLTHNRALIDQICFQFIFKGDPQTADNSTVLTKLREDLEQKKYLIDQFFDNRKVGFLVEFLSSGGKVGIIRQPKQTAKFEVPLSAHVEVDGPAGEKMHVGFIRIADLHQMHLELGDTFLDSNIRFGLGEEKPVNRAISATLKQIVLDQSESPESFAFNHNGITIHAEKVKLIDNGLCQIIAPRLLNGAQTVTTVNNFRNKNKDNPNLDLGKVAFESIRVLCKVITGPDQKFITQVTINNNRQNPVEPWNLHANDLIQLELQDKFRTDVGLYYERQENAFHSIDFSTMSNEEMEEAGIKEAKAVQMIKLTQTLLLTDGFISRLSDLRKVFEEEKIYDTVFKKARLKADSEQIILCYKIQMNLGKFTREILDKGQNKYAFISRARNLLWALLCQGLLNSDGLESLADFAEEHGNTLSVSVQYKQYLSWLATQRVRLILADLMNDPDYSDKVADGNLSFLRTDRAFDKSMAIAYKKWKWVHRKLIG
jgi:hypothetical protein